MAEDGDGSAPGRRHGRGRATRQALVRAGLEAFGRQGVDATAVDEITAAASVAKGTFYVHFNRKQDVLLEWAAELIDDIDTSALPEPADEALSALCDVVAAQMSSGPREVVGAMVREIVGNSADWVRVLEDRPTLWALIIPIVERGQAEGTLRADQSPLRLAMALTVLWLDNVVGWAERPGARPLQDSMRLTLALFMDGARTAGGEDV